MAATSASAGELAELKEELKGLKEQKAAELQKTQQARDLGLLSELNKDLDRVQAAITALWSAQPRETALRVRYDDHAPSSLNAKTFAAQQEQGVDGTQRGPPKYLCFRPAYAIGLPAPLAHPVFGHFLDDAADPELITRNDCQFLHQFCHASLQIYKREEVRQATLWPLLQQFLGMNLEPSFRVSPGEQYKANGFIGGPFCAVAILECENELGSTSSDKYAEGQNYYARFWEARMDSRMFQSTCCPCFLLEFQGPYCRISGMSFLDRVHTMPLTQMLFMSMLPHAPVQQQLCNVFAALRRGMRRLHDLYTVLLNDTSEAPADRPVALKAALPYVFLGDNPLPPSLRHPLEGMEIIDQLGETKHVYHMKSWSGKHMVVKLTQRYGLEIHETWARAGVAPQLLEFVELPGGWRMVVMEWLGEPWQRLDKLLKTLAVQQRAEAKEAALKALSLGHGSVPLSRGSQMRCVHGDARNVNVLVCRRLAAQQGVQPAPGAKGSAMEADAASSSGGRGGATGGGEEQLPAGQGQWEAMFVDFDWAGFEGESRYPLHMNHANIQWPDGADDNELMQQRHDWELLQSEQLRQAA